MTTHEITWKYILNQLVKHQNLSDTEVAWAMDQIMRPSSPHCTPRVKPPKSSALSQPA